MNALTIAIQVFLTGRLVRALGIAWTLALVPALLGLGFLALGFAPVLAVIVAVQVLRRAGDYAITRPAREMLYVVLGREEKYKAKSFIDTVVYRGGDAVSAWAYAGLRAMGLGLGAIAFVAVPVAGLWAWLAYRLGRRQEALAAERSGRGGRNGRLERLTDAGVVSSSDLGLAAAAAARPGRAGRRARTSDHEADPVER